MTDAAATRQIRAVLDMYEFGARMYRSRLRRENPEWSEEELDAGSSVEASESAEVAPLVTALEELRRLWPR